MRKRRRSKVAGVPPPPQVKVKSPKYHDLKEIYRKLVTANQSTRIAALFEAQNWWDSAIKYFLSKSSLLPEQIKKWGIAGKTRNLAIGGSNDNEKETASIHYLKQIEKIWAKELVPSVGHYYKKYEENKVHLEQKEAAATARFQTVLEALNESFKPLNRTFEIVKATNSGDSKEFNGIDKVHIAIPYAKLLSDKIKHEGILPALFSEAWTVIQSCGVVDQVDPDAPGQTKQVINVHQMIKAVPIVLDSILKYISTANPKKVFKNYSGTLQIPVVVAAVKTPKTKISHTAAKVHSPHKHRSGGNLVGGRYQANSAMAELYLRLEDQKVHSLSDLFKGLNVNNPKDRLKYLVKHGQRSGAWAIVLQGNTAKMVIP